MVGFGEARPPQVHSDVPPQPAALPPAGVEQKWFLEGPGTLWVPLQTSRLKITRGLSYSKQNYELSSSAITISNGASVICSSASAPGSRAWLENSSRACCAPRSKIKVCS